jgi:glucose-6-phosphate 1-dehydrogenase
MGRFTQNIKKAHTQKEFQKRTERMFSSLIREFISFCADAEKNGKDMSPEQIDLKIDELDTKWQYYISLSPAYFTSEAKNIFIEEITLIVKTTRERIEKEVGHQGTTEISKN